MSINGPSHEPVTNANTFGDVIIWVMTNEEFEDRILDVKNYRKSSVRAIISNAEKKVAIIYSAKENYCKLPWWWVEDGESNECAMEREGEEETGAKIKVGKYMWTIVEQNKAGKVIQYNRWYLAEVVGEIWATKLTQEEQERKFELYRMDIDEAIALIKKTSATSYRWRFMQERDIQFLQEARKIIIS